MIHNTIKTEYGDVHYWILKHSNPNADFIVFTHGITADHTMFERQIDVFKKDYSILLWDVPKHGRSRPYTHFSYRNNAEVLKAILDTIGIRSAILVGMSNGGYTSQEFGHHFPDYVKALIAIDTTPFGLKYYSKKDKLIFSMFVPMLKVFPEKLLRSQMAKSSARSAYGQALMRKMHAQLTKSDIIELASSAYDCLMAENKDTNFPFPVLILLGEYDKALSVDKYSIAWSKDKGYPLKIIKDAAHFSNADNHEAVNFEIKHFIDHL